MNEYERNIMNTKLIRYLNIYCYLLFRNFMAFVLGPEDAKMSELCIHTVTR